MTAGLLTLTSANPKPGSALQLSLYDLAADLSLRLASLRLACFASSITPRDLVGSYSRR
jgi:hypothetical protein